MAFDINVQRRIQPRQIQTTKRNIPLEQIIAVEGYNPLAEGIQVAGVSVGSALTKRAELRRQGEQLAKLEALGGFESGQLGGLDPSVAASFASANRKQKTDVQEEVRKLAQANTKIRGLEAQFGYKPGELGDDHASALMKVQNDNLIKRQNQGAAAENRKLREEQFNEKQLMSYSKQLQATGIPGAISTAQEILSQLPEKGQDIPGFGPAEQYLPNFMVSDQGRSLRQAVGQLFNIELKTRSGVAVTDPELQRLKVEFGQGHFATEESLRNGVRQFLARMSQIARNVDAGVAGNIKQQYLDEGGQDIPGSFEQLLSLKKIAPPTPRALPQKGFSPKEEEEYQKWKRQQSGDSR